MKIMELWHVLVDVKGAVSQQSSSFCLILPIRESSFKMTRGGMKILKLEA